MCFKTTIKFKLLDLVFGLRSARVSASFHVQALPSAGTPFASTPTLAGPNRPLPSLACENRGSLPPPQLLGPLGLLAPPPEQVWAARSFERDLAATISSWGPRRPGEGPPPCLSAAHLVWAPRIPGVGGVPGWQVDPGGSQRRRRWLSQRLPAPRLPESVLLCLTVSLGVSKPGLGILCLCSFVPWAFMSALCVPGPVLAAGDSRTDPAPAATDSGTGCSLHQSTQLRGEGAPGRGHFL